MKPLGIRRFPYTMVAAFGFATSPILLAQWTGLGAGGAATDASDPLNYTGGSIGNFSGNTATAILDLVNSSTTVGGLNLNYTTNSIALTLGDGAGPQILTLAGDVTFARAATVLGTSSFITDTDVILDLGAANRSITGTTVAGDLGSFNLTFNGAITSNGSGNQRLTISAGSPTTIFNGNVTLDGGMTFSSGTNTVSASSILNVTGAGANALQSTAGNTIATINGQLVAGASDSIGVSGGILWLANSTNNYSGVHTVSGGILRGADGAGIKSGNIQLSGGVFESTTTTAFTRSLGTGNDQVRLTGGNTGFSSRGAAAVFNIGGAGATLEWGSTNFNPGNLVIGSGNSDNSTELVNGIDLKGGSRQIYFNSTFASGGGIISGVISDSTGGGGITLNSQNNSNVLFLLTADNIYTGRTVIANSAGATGTLAITKDRALGATPVTTLIDNVILATNGVLRATESFELDSRRGLGIGGSGGGSVTGTINVDSTKTLTYKGIVANRTKNIDGTNSSANTGTLRKTGSGTLNLFGQANTYTGSTALSTGTLRIMKMSNGGAASSIGAAAGAATDLQLGGGRLEYIGYGDTTNRLFSHTASTTIDSSGTGALNFNNTGAIVSTNTTARTISLTGTNTGNNNISGGITDASAGTTSIAKFGSGTWALSGTNGYTGSTRAVGGNLVLDYSGAGNTADPISATSAISISGGALTFKGRTSGATTDTVASVALNSALTTGGLNKLVLDSNGGSGFGLTIGTLIGSGSVQASSLIDMSSSAGNSITVNNLGATIAAVASTTSNVSYPVGPNSNVLMANSNRAQYIVRDSTGYGFATLSTAAAASTATPGATIGKLTTGIDLDAIGSAGSTTNTDNVRLDASTTRNSALVFQTLTIDASNADITLGMGGNAIGTSSGSAIGRGILVYGDKNVSFTGAGTFATSGSNSLFVHHYGTGLLDISQSIIGGTIEFAGPGVVNLGGTIANNNNLIAQGNVLRLSGATNLNANTSSTINISSGGVLEIGNDLNSAVDGDFSLAVGTAAGQIRFQQDSGVSAFGADRVVNFGGASAALSWGASGFLVTNESTPADGDFTFKLSSAASNAKVTVQNGINLNNRNRTIEVANGSAAVDAAISGAITGDGVGFNKTGSGTLEISNTSTYSGFTRVLGGELRVTGSINSSTQVLVKDATLRLGAANVLNDSADITLDNGRIITNGNAETTGPLALIGNNQLDLISVGNIIRIADSSTAVWGSTLVITDWTGNSTGNGSDQVYFGSNANGLTAEQLAKVNFLNPNIDGVAQTGTYSANILATGEIVAGVLIPEASAVLLGSLGALGFALRRRRN